MNEPSARSVRQPAASGRTMSSRELEQRNFRRRRIVDAACALPFLGIVLWWLPLLWQGGDSSASTAHVLIYIFVVWCVLPIAAGLLIRAIRKASLPDRPEMRE